MAHVVRDIVLRKCFRTMPTVLLRTASLSNNVLSQNFRYLTTSHYDHKNLNYTDLSYFAFRNYSSYPDHNIINLPSLSPTMETGSIVSWSKNIGDKIEEGDLLAEIETDKATMAMEASDSGYLAKIFYETGSKDIPIGRPLCIIVQNEADVSAFKDFQLDPASVSAPAKKPEAAKPAPAAAAPAKAPPAPAATPAPAPAMPAVSAPMLGSGGGRVMLSPLARATAAAGGIQISQLLGLAGSGTWGELRSADVEQFIRSGGAGAGATVTSATSLFTPGEAFVDIPLTAMRATIAKRLLASKQNVPHYYLTMDVSMDTVLALRERINQQRATAKSSKKPLSNLSVNDFILKAAASACLQVPECNSAWMDTFIRQFNTVDISVAVATPNGLITPIVFNVERRGLGSINEDVKRLAEKARQGKLQPNEFQGGTFTISNLGMFGIKNFCAIINPPQACILAVGGTDKRVVVDERSPLGYRVSHFMSVTLCCDHRVVDGAVGAEWLNHFKNFLQDPSSMIL